MTRWERLTATKGRVVTVFGGWAIWLAAGLVVTQEFALGTSTGGYVILAAAFVWTGALALIEARWKRQDEASSN